MGNRLFLCFTTLKCCHPCIQEESKDYYDYPEAETNTESDDYDYDYDYETEMEELDSDLG